jgi:hypothetical protein
MNRIGRFIFDDHIRCVTARQYLDQGRIKLREEKLNQVERMLCIAKPKHAPPPSSEYGDPAKRAVLFG